MAKIISLSEKSQVKIIVRDLLHLLINLEKG